jgi:nitrogen regulatory protein PII
MSGAAGFVSPLSALVLGGLSALPSYLFLLYRPRTRLDDSLDVFGAHGLAGITGALLTGILVEKAWNHEKVRLEIGVSEPFVKPTVEAILKAARTGEVGDGKVFVIPVEKVYRIRTGEEDEAAVTPVQ